eukprot:jgi/Botrbrau1/13655/Bobra.0292s0005.1
MSRKLLPLFDRVLVEKILPATLKTPGGVLLPENLKKLDEGIVRAVGPGGRTPEGNLVPVGVKEGDKVLLPEYGGTKVGFGEKDVELALYREDELLGIIKES